MQTNNPKKEFIASVFDRAARGYAQLPYFPPFGRRLVEIAQIPYGASVLDIDSGRGAVLFPAAEQVGPYGHVTGIELSSGMVQETCAALQARGVKHAEITRMDAEDHQFPDDVFDQVLCGFALWFFPHLSQALSEFHRVLKPGGRLSVSTWGQDDERWNWHDEQRAAYGIFMKLTAQMLDKPDELCTVFRQAGFEEINICADEEEWWSAMWSISSRPGWSS